MNAPLSPWMAKIDPETREAVHRNVTQAPPLTTRQRDKLRLLFLDHATIEPNTAACNALSRPA